MMISGCFGIMAIVKELWGFAVGVLLSYLVMLHGIQWGFPVGSL